jgi:hypothetical protein
MLQSTGLQKDIIEMLFEQKQFPNGAHQSGESYPVVDLQDKRRAILKIAGFYIFGILFIVLTYYAQDYTAINVPFLLVLILVFAGLTVYSVSLMRGQLDLVSSVEFQNAIFASAFSEGKLFSLIVSFDEEMYYADAGFYKLYPHLTRQGGHVLDEIVKYADDPLENKARLDVTSQDVVHI